MSVAQIIKTLTLAVIASEARQSSALVGQSGLLRRFAPRNDGEGAFA
jgi:hypothetical protein